MTRHAVRLTLLAALAVALLAAAWHIFRLDQRLDTRTQAAHDVTQSAARFSEAMFDARASQRAYIASTQGPEFWTARVNADHETMAAALDDLRLASTTAASRTALDRVAEALGELTRLERRIAGHATAGRRQHAEDLIYADALQASVALERELHLATQALLAEQASIASALRGQQLMAALGAGAFALLICAALTRRPKTAVQAAEPAAQVAGGPTALDDQQAAAAVEAAPAEQVAAPRPSHGMRRSHARAASPAALQAAAEVCGALARVQESRELPGLVERISRVLDSKGTIVWVRDERIDSLRPAVSFGYSAAVLGRMGTIPLTSDTPVAQAVRLGESRAVQGAGDIPGALVVPIVAPAGVVGAITLELPPGNERQPATLALSRIFAAQLAGLIGGTDDGQEERATGTAAAGAARSL
ncbi:MAG TPA: GAF domain-containing protein [Vicinamibacterales bacterium]